MTRARANRWLEGPDQGWHADAVTGRDPETEPETGLGALLARGFSSFDRPDPSLDPFLDAFGAVATRFGVGRTRMQDLANELGMDRTTVFRNAGRMDTIIERYMAREVHGFFEALVSNVPTDLDGPSTVVELVATAIERAQSHPVLAKALADEPQLVASLSTTHLGPLLDHVHEVIATGLALFAGIGQIGSIDTEAVADWIARFGVTAVLEPLPDVRATLGAVLTPLLAP